MSKNDRFGFVLPDSIFKDLDVAARISRECALTAAGLQMPGLEELKRSLEVRYGPLVAMSHKLAEQAAALRIVSLDDSVVKQLTAASSFSLARESQWKSLVGVAGVQPDYLKGIADQIGASSLYLTGLADASLARMDWGRSVLSGVREAMRGYERSYSDLMSSLGASGILGLPPTLARLPSAEFFGTADLLEQLSGQDTEAAAVNESVRTELAEDIEAIVVEMLGAFDARFLPMRLGAVAALRSNNPDRVRHFSVSMRELFDHLLRTLAPDAEVRAWTQADSDYYKNRPTRAARFRYVCRSIGVEKLPTFAAWDAKVALSLLDEFQEGTHTLEPVSDAQAESMGMRMDSLIRFLLELAQVVRGRMN
jgi:hypothetical protein